MKLYRVVLLLMKINTFLMEGTTMLDISLAATPHNSFYSRWPGYHSVRGVIIIIRIGASNVDIYIYNVEVSQELIV